MATTQFYSVSGDIRDSGDLAKRIINDLVNSDHLPFEGTHSESTFNFLNTPSNAALFSPVNKTNKQEDLSSSSSTKRTRVGPTLTAPFSKLHHLEDSTSVSAMTRPTVPYRLEGWTRFYAPRPEHSRENFNAIKAAIKAMHEEDDAKIGLRMLVDNLEALDRANQALDPQDNICVQAGLPPHDCISVLFRKSSDFVMLNSLLPGRYDHVNCEMPEEELDRVFKTGIPASLCQLFRVWYAACVLFEQEKIFQDEKDKAEAEKFLSWNKTPFCCNDKGSFAMNIQVRVLQEDLNKYFCVCRSVVDVVKNMCEVSDFDGAKNVPSITMNYFVACTPRSKKHADGCVLSVVCIDSDTTNDALVHCAARSHSRSSSRRVTQAEKNFYTYSYMTRDLVTCDLENLQNTHQHVVSRSRPLNVYQVGEHLYVAPQVSAQDLEEIIKTDKLDENLQMLRQVIETTFPYVNSLFKTIFTTNPTIQPAIATKIEQAWPTSIFGSQLNEKFPVPGVIRSALSAMDTVAKVRFLACFQESPAQIRAERFLSGMTPSLSETIKSISAKQDSQERAKRGGGACKSVRGNYSNEMQQNGLKLRHVANYRMAVFLYCVVCEIVKCRHFLLHDLKNLDQVCDEDEQFDSTWRALVGLVDGFTGFTLDTVHDTSDIQNCVFQWDREVLNPVSRTISSEATISQTSQMSSSKAKASDGDMVQFNPHEAGDHSLFNQTSACFPVWNTIFGFMRVTCFRMLYGNEEMDRANFRQMILDLQKHIAGAVVEKIALLMGGVHRLPNAVLVATQMFQQIFADETHCAGTASQFAKCIQEAGSKSQIGNGQSTLISANLIQALTGVKLFSGWKKPSASFKKDVKAALPSQYHTLATQLFQIWSANGGAEVMESDETQASIEHLKASLDAMEHRVKFWENNQRQQQTYAAPTSGDTSVPIRSTPTPKTPAPTTTGKTIICTDEPDQAVYNNTTVVIVYAMTTSSASINGFLDPTKALKNGMPIDKCIDIVNKTNAGAILQLYGYKIKYIADANGDAIKAVNDTMGVMNVVYEKDPKPSVTSISLSFQGTRIDNITTVLPMGSEVSEEILSKARSVITAPSSVTLTTANFRISAGTSLLCIDKDNQVHWMPTGIETFKDYVNPNFVGVNGNPPGSTDITEAQTPNKSAFYDKTTKQPIASA